MNLVNPTKLLASYTMSTAPDGRESLVVVVKGTYTIPDQEDKPPRLADKPMPLVMTDEFTGEPGFSAPLYEIDFAPRKPRCDVLLNGSAYAPGGKPTERVQVTLQVGGLSKSFNVVGNRVYKAGALYIAVSDITPFTVMPISYNNAFGGVDRSNEDPAKHRWYLLNHAGVGFHADTSAKALNDKPLPNTEEIGHAVSNPGGNYKPMAFGPVGRSWQPRIKWAGTYDQKWRDETCPFLPKDFDDRYFQAAAEDQQMSYPKGGEPVVLTNLTPQGRTAFRLPDRVRLPVVFFLRDGTLKEVPAVVDTILLEPDKKRFALVWRASLPLRRTIREVTLIKLGQTARYWERLERRATRGKGKRRFASLAELVGSARQPSPPDPDLEPEPDLEDEE
jgi:hypothetical protein